MTIVRLDVAEHLNNTGCALPGVVTPNGLDGLGRVYPAEEIGVVCHLAGRQPPAWGHGAPDNIECDGQRIDFPSPQAVVAVGVLGASAGGSFADEMLLRCAFPDGADLSLPFELTDFLASQPARGERCAVACSRLRERGVDVVGPIPRMWTFEASCAVPCVSVGIELPVNPALHVFAIWIVTADDGGTGSLT